MPHARLASAVFIIAAMAGSACSLDIGGPPPSQAGRAEVEAVSACRERADQVFDRQNRGQVYNTDTYRSITRDAPFTTNGLVGVTSAGLSQQYSRDNMVQNCLRESGAGGVAPMSRDLESNLPSPQ